MTMYAGYKLSSALLTVLKISVGSKQVFMILASNVSIIVSFGTCVVSKVLIESLVSVFSSSVCRDCILVGKLPPKTNPIKEVFSNSTDLSFII